jgi:transposase
MLLRADSLAKAMSRYLIDRIDQTANIEVRSGVEVTAVRGAGRLEAITTRDVDSGEERELTVAAMFIFVGKRATRVKVLWWERNGYCLLYKRLHRALFAAPAAEPGAKGVRIDGAALGQLLAGVEQKKKKRMSRLH